MRQTKQPRGSVRVRRIGWGASCFVNAECVDLRICWSVSVTRERLKHCALTAYVEE